MSELRTLYPEIEPFESGMLDVGDGHRVRWERVGTRGAKPAVFLHGGPGAANGLTRADDTDRRVSLNGYAVLGQTKIGGGAIERRIDAASDSRLGLYYLGASYTFAGPWQLDGQLSRLDVKDSPKASNLAVLRATYFLSKRTAIHASLGRMQNKGGAAIALDAGGTVGAGLNQSGLLAGVRHTF